MEEHCVGYNELAIESKEEILKGLWEELPPPLRERERDKLKADRRLKKLVYDPDRWQTFEAYTYSPDYRARCDFGAREAKERGAINHENISHSPFMVCEGCEYDDGRGHPSQRYHMGEGGCLRMHGDPK